MLSLTRSYFLDCVTDWSELIELCREYDCDICEDIIDDDELNEYVNSDISNTDYGWRSIRDFLADIPTGYDYYRCDGSFDYVGLDDSDFEDYKSRVLDSSLRARKSLSPRSRPSRRKISPFLT